MSTLRVTRDGRVSTVQLGKPPHGFMTDETVAELLALVRSLERDRSARSVVLTGAVEGVFVRHYDVEQILSGSEGVPPPPSAPLAGAALRAAGAVLRLPGGRDALLRTPLGGAVPLLELHEALLRMQRSDKVFVAAVNGLALGGGCELALACDVRLIADGPGAIGLIESLMGLNPGGGGTQRLARSIGHARAVEMMLEGRPLDAREAVELGVAHRAVAPERLVEEAVETAERLARRSPESVLAIKRAVYFGGTRRLPAGLALERARFMLVTTSPRALRGMRAYIDRVQGLPPARVLEALERDGWRDGTAVDPTSG